jgi:hypothetical protein
MARLKLSKEVVKNLSVRSGVYAGPSPVMMGDPASAPPAPPTTPFSPMMGGKSGEAACTIFGSYNTKCALPL